MLHDVFLSYTAADEDWTKRLKDALERRGVKVWVACQAMRAGDAIPSAIEKAMECSGAVAFVISPESLASPWVEAEYQLAVALSNKRVARPLRIIPVLLRQVEMPPFLSTHHYADFRDDTRFDEGVASLVAGIGVQDLLAAVSRVCFISPEYPPIVCGGLGIHVEKLTTALACKFAVEVVLPDPGTEQYLNLEPKVRPVPMSVSAHYGDPLSWCRFAGYVAAKLESLPPAQRPGVLHCHDWATVLAGVKSKWRLGIPLVFHLHLPNRNPICACLENLGLICADVVTVNSDAMFVEVKDRRLPIRDIRVVKNAVDLNMFRPAEAWPGHDNYILFVGRLVEQKGVEYLVRAFSYVREKYPDIRLKIVGDGEFREWLERLCQNLLLTSEVEFLGWVPHDELAALYQAARVVAVPSVFEPFGMVALEALACQRPVVASRAGGLKEIVQHGRVGFLAEPKDHLDLAQWLMALLSDPELCQRMGENGRARISEEGYTWPAVAEQFAQLYECVKKRPLAKDPPDLASVLGQQLTEFAGSGEKWEWQSFLWDLFQPGVWS